LAKSGIVLVVVGALMIVAAAFLYYNAINNCDSLYNLGPGALENQACVEGYMGPVNMLFYLSLPVLLVGAVLSFRREKPKVSTSIS
jgi:hypothetical protein